MGGGCRLMGGCRNIIHEDIEIEAEVSRIQVEVVTLKNVFVSFVGVNWFTPGLQGCKRWRWLALVGRAGEMRIWGSLIETTATLGDTKGSRGTTPSIIHWRCLGDMTVTSG